MLSGAKRFYSAILIAGLLALCTAAGAADTKKGVAENSQAKSPETSAVSEQKVRPSRKPGNVPNPRFRRAVPAKTANPSPAEEQGADSTAIVPSTDGKGTQNPLSAPPPPGSISTSDAARTDDVQPSHNPMTVADQPGLRPELSAPPSPGEAQVIPSPVPDRSEMRPEVRPEIRPEARPEARPDAGPAATPEVQPEKRVDPGPGAPPPALPQPGFPKARAVPAPINDRETFNLNFDNADLNEVIEVLAKSLQLNYIVDSRVKGTVTIHTAGKVPKTELFAVLEQILKMNGVAIVKTGDIYKIMPFGEAQTEALSPHIEGGRGEAKPAGQDFIIQLMPLKFVPAAQMAKILKPFLTPGANIYEIPVGNLLLVTDLSSNIKKLIEMVNIFDIQIFENIKVELLAIQNTSAEEIITDLEAVFGAYGLLAKDKQAEGGIRFVPISRLNSVMAITSSAELLAQAAGWIKKLDERAELGTDVHVYFVENVKAEDLASVLNQIYTESKKGAAKAAPVKAGDAKRNVPAKPAANAKGAEAPGELEGEVRIIPDKGSNALVIMATPEDYKTISLTVKKLDVVPRQVMIEVMIAEITLGDSLQHGINWWLQHEEAKVPLLGGKVTNKTTLLGSVPAGGFAYSLLDGANVRALLSLLASESRLNVLSAPSIVASNNQKATISVGSQVPIVTSEYVPLATTTENQTQQSSTSRTIQYRDTGVLLTVTPHINSARLVTLEISQEVSDAQETTTGVTSTPTIFKRKAETSVVVYDGQSALIGGLIQERKSVSHSGIPFLKDIPVLGWLFGGKTTSVNRTELLVLLTPRVVTERQELDQVTREMMNKIDSLKSMIEAHTSRGEGPCKVVPEAN
ncbi:MAG: type II secretion system secretin GspD [Pseudomonadota bacterium]